MSPPTLQDKVAVIAGGGKNLGALVATQFAEAGARGLVLHVRFLVTEGWWITGQTIFANGGYTTR